VERGEKDADVGTNETLIRVGPATVLIDVLREVVNCEQRVSKGYMIETTGIWFDQCDQKPRNSVALNRDKQDWNRWDRAPEINCH
jgi:hypothetical protein